MKNGIIIILHTLHKTISEEEVLTILPSKYLDRPRIFLRVQPTFLDIAESQTQDFFALAVKQRNQYLEEIKPLLEDSTYTKVVYFGAAPIPLAMQLGFLIGDYEDIEVYQHHHDLKTWEWQEPDIQETVVSHVENVPRELYRSNGDIQIRMSTSVRVDETHCKEILKEPVKDIHIYMDQPGRDIFTRQSELTIVSGHFRDVLDSIQSNLPNIDLIHFFGAIPVGLAFLLGTKVNPTIHKPIQTYQFRIDATPKYSAAILIQASSNENRAISDEETQEAKLLRTELNQMLQNQIGAFIANIKETDHQEWFTAILPQNTFTNHFNTPRWYHLPMISELRLLEDNIPIVVKDAYSEGFFYEAGEQSWFLSDPFIIALRRNLSLKEDFMRAVRMFLFHEALHFTKHQITSTTGTGVGNFPKVLEEADYQADVWTMFHEYNYTSRQDKTVFDNPRSYFIRLIDTAIQTMWSFFPQEGLIRQMQIRRVNRFLMWYWQFLLIEKLPNNSTLNDLVPILLQKPSIELVGPPIKSYNQRVFFDLTIPDTSTPEFAVFHNNRVARFGQTSSLNIIGLIAAFRSKDSDLIKSILRGVVESMI